jgi:hypothetical protein
MSDDTIRQLLALVQLGRRAREAANVEALGFVMLNETLQLIPYRQAAWWRSGTVGRVAGVSGLPRTNPSAPYTQWLSRLFRAILKRADSGAALRLTAADLPEVGEEWIEWLPPYALWLPLRSCVNRDERALHGGLLLVADTAWQDHDIAIASELAHCYGHAPVLIVPERKAGARLRELLSTAPRRRWMVLALLVLMLLPVEQSVLVPAEVVPKQPFLVRAPQDGVLDRVLVQPNQTVQPGTPLFNLDTSVLQTRNALARKAYDEAQEQYRQAAQLAVTEDKSKLEMAQRHAAVEEKSLELAYATEQLGRIQVRATHAGVAVFGDANELEGKAVATGERIMTVANPRQVELAIQLPANERFAVQPGARATLYPNASPLSAYAAQITQVAYSAELTHDGLMAYRLKAQFAPDIAPPRIGLMGSAKLHGSRVPLIYFALRRPLTMLRQWLGW